MKTILLTLLPVLICGCATTPQRSDIPEYDKVKRIFYNCYNRTVTPNCDVYDNIQVCIWMHDKSDPFMRYFSGPEIIHAYHGTNRIFMSEQFDARISPESVRELYAGLRAGCLSTLPRNDNPIPLYRAFGFFMLNLTDDASWPTWNFKDTLPVTGEQILLHDRLMEFTRARIAEQPGALQIRRIVLNKGDNWPPRKKTDTVEPPAAASPAVDR